MRTIDLIIIHCSATRADRDYPLEALRRDHQARGFTDVARHFCKYSRMAVYATECRFSTIFFLASCG